MSTPDDTMAGSEAEAITIRADLGGGAEGYLVIDTTVENGSAGGLRVAEDLSLAEVATLAREMTLKFAFIGRRNGGAKSGLRIPADATPSEKRRWLAAFGRHLGPLLRRGIYHAGTDINCSRDDLAALYAGAGMRPGAMTDTALFTAIGAGDALAACRESLGAPSRPLRVAVEGFGSAAAHLCERLPPGEFRITAVSTLRGAVVAERGFDPAQLVETRRRFGDGLVERIEGARAHRDAVFAAEVDVFVPSARAWSLSAVRARALRARAVVPLANAPYGEGAVDVLESRGIACLPGIVANCGGVFLSSLYDTGVPFAEVERVSSRYFRPVVKALLDARASYGASPVRTAEAIALARLGRRTAQAIPASPYRRVARKLVHEHVPRWLRGRRYRAWFESNLVELEELVRDRGRRGTPMLARRTGS